ncbi:ArgS-related anticodon-binding protein NrtL [Streptomyces sp. NPDC058572]|uniref:ArgS-related anticodon-binding protein NrtL n=1 Tax=Streptomyces sp. NPDC058572 TaxID=3346546 RepID=UPI0036612171
MTPAELSLTVHHAVRRAVEEGVLQAPVPESGSIKLERPRPGGHGDYATGIALRLAKAAAQEPRRVAEMLRDRIAQASGIERVDITGPGFLNITLGGGTQQMLVRTVRESGRTYGSGDSLAGTSVRFRIEGDRRAALWTSAVSDLLSTQGARTDVTAGGETVLSVVPAPDQDFYERLGPDAARWAVLSAAAHDRPRTGDEWLVQHERNPLFRVRYACSRTRALTRAAARLGMAAAPEEHVDAPALTAAVRDYPAVTADAARLRAPDRIARHLDVTSDAFLAFQHTVLPVGDEKPSAAHRSRLALAEAAGTVLAGGLSLLGISAPEYL